jgi:hypothetical protein
MSDRGLDDDGLLRAVGEVIDDRDPVPRRAVEVAGAAFELHGVDDELAELVADSLVDAGAGVRHDGRAGSDGRLLSFEGAGLTLDVELLADGATVIGEVAPPARAVVEVRTAEGTAVVETDDAGRFLARLGRGPCRFRVSSGGATVVTPWVTR